MKKDFLIQAFIRNKIISDDDIQLYRFGIECFLLKVINFVSYFFIGFLMKMPIETLIIGLVVIPLRRSAGGYHAKTKIGCYAFSCTVLLSMLCMCKILSVYSIWYILEVGSNIIILKYAPLDNENKKLDDIEKKYFRKNTYIILVLINLICILAMLFGQRLIIKSLIAGMCISAFLLIICRKYE